MGLYLFISAVYGHMAGVAGFEPTKCGSQSAVPYHLATPQYNSRRYLCPEIGIEPIIFAFEANVLTF